MMSFTALIFYETFACFCIFSFSGFLAFIFGYISDWISVFLFYYLFFNVTKSWTYPVLSRAALLNCQCCVYISPFFDPLSLCISCFTYLPDSSSHCCYNCLSRFFSFFVRCTWKVQWQAIKQSPSTTYRRLIFYLYFISKGHVALERIFYTHFSLFCSLFQTFLNG